MTSDHLTVAVTGPTGEVGRSLIPALERAPQVVAVRAMGRRDLSPRILGWRKTEYLRGDVCCPADVAALVDGANVVVHLAFVKFGGRGPAHRVNLAGSRNVFEAAVAGGARRIVYTSSVAAYGFAHAGPGLLTEDVPATGCNRMCYAAEKAELEQVLAEVLRGTGVEGYVLRPCIVAGPDSLELVTRLPYVWAAAAVPGRLRGLLGVLPAPVLPDFGVPAQLVHGEDLALALRAAVLGRGEPGVYNLAGPGQITATELAAALGWHALRLPSVSLAALTELATRTPLAGEHLDWMHALRVPLLVDSRKARRLLGWRPRHSASQTLAQTVASARSRRILGGRTVETRQTTRARLAQSDKPLTWRERMMAP